MVIFVNHFILSIQKGKCIDNLLTNLLKSPVKKVFLWNEYRNELSSGSLGQSIFSSNLAAEKEACLKTVNSAMKADIAREKKKPGIMALYSAGNAIFHVQFKIHNSQKPGNCWNSLLDPALILCIKNGLKCWKTFFTGDFDLVGKQEYQRTCLLE